MVAGCGRRTASVWRLLFSQSVGVEESGRSGAAHRDPGSVLHIYGRKTITERPSDRPAGRSGAEQHGTVRAAGRPGPAPQKLLLFIYRVCELFFPTWRLQAAGCYWLHTSSSSANKVRHANIHLCPPMIQKPLNLLICLDFIKTVWFSTCRANVR